jgi:hypothetical protein
MPFYPSVTQNNGSEPFELQVARVQVGGHTGLFRFGYSNSLGTTAQTLSTVVAAGATYVYPASAGVLKVSSASANDTSDGTGTRTIQVEGLDANYAPISEVVIMDGQTPVNTVNSFLRVLYLEVLTYGSVAGAAGNIYAGTGTVTAGVPATVYGQIDTGYNNFSFAGYTVPAGFTAYVTSYTITTQSTTPNINVSAALVEREFSANGLMSEIQSTLRLVAGGSFDRHFDVPFVIEEKNDFELRAWASTGAAVNATGEIQFILIANAS